MYLELNWVVLISTFPGISTLESQKIIIVPPPLNWISGNSRNLSSTARLDVQFYTVLRVMASSVPLADWHAYVGEILVDLLVASLILVDELHQMSLHEG